MAGNQWTTVHQWLHKTTNTPISADLVPGASERELSALAGLGAVAGFLMSHSPGEGSLAVDSLPASVMRWIERAPELPGSLAAVVTAGFAEDPDEYLASLYARSVLPRNRRRLGTFFTPAAEVELMLSMWDRVAGAPTSVIDIGAGVGVFTAAAARRWPSSTIDAVDINPVTLGLLAARLRGPGQTYPNVRLVHGDITELLGATRPPDAGARLLLGNPPYTRAQLLPIAERRRLQTLAAGLCGSRASLSTVITAISLLSLQAADGLCLLLPAQWLESQYASELRRTLWESKRRRVELRLVASDLFEEAQVDAVALLVGPEEAKAGLYVSTWHATRPSSSRAVVTLDPPANWRALFADESSVRPPAAPASGEPREPEARTLADIATVKRGIATGANSYFALDAATRKSARVARWSKRRIVTRLRGLSIDLTAAEDQEPQSRRWLLEASKDQVRNHPALAAYVLTGERTGLNERVLCARRAVWYDLRSEVFVPDVIIGPMSRGSFRLIENGVRATITNNLYGLTWSDEVSRDEKDRVLRWLRSDIGQAAMRSIARTQGNGLVKIEPRALQQLALPW